MKVILFISSNERPRETLPSAKRVFSHLGEGVFDTSTDGFKLTLALDDFESEQSAIQQTVKELRNLSFPGDMLLELSIREQMPGDSEEESPPFFECTGSINDLLGEEYWRAVSKFCVQINISPALSATDFSLWSHAIKLSFPSADTSAISNGVEVFGTRATLAAQLIKDLPPLDDLLKLAVAVTVGCRVPFERLNVFAHTDYDAVIYRKPSGELSIREPSGEIKPWIP